MEKSDEQRIYELALHFIPGIGSVHAKNLISYLGGLKQVFSAQKRELLRVPGIGEKKCLDILNSNVLIFAEKELRRVERFGIETIFYLDDDYPERLKHFSVSPVLLYKKGGFDLNYHRMIGIVGTRNPTSRGRDVCQNIVEELKPFNACIVSGLAYGIDSNAHSKAVDLNMPTIGILGSGLDTIYPGSNRGLSEKMIQYGAVLSEFPLGTKPDRENFPKRNRVIAALADALIVVESAKKGGSIITTEYANEFSKDVFAVPGRINDPMSEGCNHLIKTHMAHLLSNINDLSYIMRWSKQNVQKQLAFVSDLKNDERIVYDMIRENELIALDELTFKSQINLSGMSSILLNLEIRGLIKSKPGKKYILSSKT